MSLTLAITLIVLADVALLAGLCYMMSRAKLLTPHVSRNDTPPAALTNVARRRDASAPALRAAAARKTHARHAGSFATEA